MQHDEEYVIRLKGFDLGQMLDGLEVRSRAWRDTATYLETGVMPSPDFVVEDCTDVDEARQLAAHYDRIIAQILEQRARQDQ